MACERPADSEVPLARWSSSELAVEVVAPGICEQISVVTVRRRLSEEGVRFALERDDLTIEHYVPAGVAVAA